MITFERGSNRMGACSTCGAIVSVSEQQRHIDWHQKHDNPPHEHDPRACCTRCGWHAMPHVGCVLR